MGLVRNLVKKTALARGIDARNKLLRKAVKRKKKKPESGEAPITPVPNSETLKGSSSNQGKSLLKKG